MCKLQEYEQIIKQMNAKKFKSIEQYLKTHPDVVLSDIMYKTKNYMNFNKWYNWKILNRTVRILNIYETEFDDVQVDTVLYVHNKAVGNILASYGAKDISIYSNNDSKLEKEALSTVILDDFDKYMKLPKISECSKLLQDIYANVCESESSMCHITEEDWNLYYEEDYSEKDIKNLVNEVHVLGLEDVITFNDCEYKIIGWGDLATRFNNDKYLKSQIIKERGDRE